MLKDQMLYYTFFGLHAGSSTSKNHGIPLPSSTSRPQPACRTTEVFSTLPRVNSAST
jgi:hypothetical protein